MTLFYTFIVFKTDHAKFKVSTGSEYKMSTRKIQNCLISFVIGSVLFLITGWFLIASIVTIMGIVVSLSGKKINLKTSVKKLEDIATWTELLRDLLSSSAGLAQTIVSSYDISPESLKPGLLELSLSIKAGNSMSTSIQRFADWLNDPVGDLVCMVLINAANGKAYKIGNLLGDLAESTRQEVTMQMRVEASRSSTKASMRTIVCFSASFFIGLSILARSYMQPFRSLVGQLVLLVVLILYMTGIFLMKKMSSFKERDRLLI